MAILFLFAEFFELNIFAESKGGKGEDFVIQDGVLIKYQGTEENVVVPDGVLEIQAYAFKNNQLIKSIILPDGLVSIGSGTFLACRSLKTVKLPKTLATIGNMAFWYCENLIDIDLGDAITSIGGDAFIKTKWLNEKIKEDPLLIINGILVDGSTCQGNVKIPDSVTHINANSFSNNKQITSVEIPDSVKSIGMNAFDNSYVTTVKMGNLVETIEEDAFRWCTKLKNIRLSSSLKKIEYGTFAYCHQLKNITIPESVEYIEMGAFADCRRLKYITVSEGLELENEYEFSTKTTNKNQPTIYVPNLKNTSYIAELAKEKDYPLSELKLQTQKITLKQGEVYELRMNSYAKCDSWKSSNQSVVSVNYYGKITAKKKGTTVITAILYGKEYQCTVIVQ